MCSNFFTLICQYGNSFNYKIKFLKSRSKPPPPQEPIKKPLLVMGSAPNTPPPPPPPPIDGFINESSNNAPPPPPPPMGAPMLPKSEGMSAALLQNIRSGTTLKVMC